MTSGAVLCGIVAFLPSDSIPTSVIYYSIGIATVTATIVGVRRHRPADPSSWYVFAIGISCFVVGDLLYEVTSWFLGGRPYPYWNDALYFVGYPFLWAGLLLVARRRGGSRDSAGLIDAAIIGTAAALVNWVFLVNPVLGDETTPMLERLVSAGYPVSDVLMLAVVARMLTRSRGRTPSVLMLAAGSTLALACDVLWTISMSSDGQVGSFINAGFLLGYVCWAGAALHPSMRRESEGGPVAGGRFGRGRLIVLTAATLLVPAVLFLQGFRDESVDWAAVGIGAVVIFLLVLTRMYGFVGQVQKQAEQLADLAMSDELTGLANRRQFAQRLTDAVAAGSPQVCMLDLNGFKAVNDRLGHAVGDSLLTVVAERLTKELRAGDVVARMGGDEFAILLLDTSVAEGNAIVTRLSRVLSQPATVGGEELRVGGSIGIADSDGTDDPVEVMRRADAAMYAAKAADGTYRRYTSDLDHPAGAEPYAVPDTLGTLPGPGAIVDQAVAVLPAPEVVVRVGAHSGRPVRRRASHRRPDLLDRVGLRGTHR
ncbi:GGDEF domain-containing protein [Actinoplanes sp. NPDC049118]|uniref:GGDEF domain-containing protein n=1 Tax=Actinoplanes sp. NPDC049118 TaxID=3155769 RepID=UPI0034068A8C